METRSREELISQAAAERETASVLDHSAQQSEKLAELVRGERQDDTQDLLHECHTDMGYYAESYASGAVSSRAYAR